MSRKIVQDDKELLHLSQVELKNLQRQYRIMEGDKNSYASEIKCNLTKQRKIIGTLSYEEKILKEKLFSEKYIEDVNNQWTKSYSDLFKKYEKYLYLMKQKKDIIYQYNKKIKSLECETKVLLFYGDIKSMQMNENIEKFLKHIEQLQNKLHNETVKYDKALAENVCNRQEVDALLKDRAKFNELYKKLVIKLNADKKKLLVMIEKATAACEQRDDADEKLKSSIHKEYQETLAQRHKMKELHRQLDHLIQLKEFLSVKGRRRILVDLEEKKNEKKLQKTLLTENFIKKYNCILEQIKEFCNELNTEKLPAIFIKQEEENFAFFNYVNEINNEVENLRDEVQLLKASLKQQKKINVSSQRKRTESFESLKQEIESRKQLIAEENEKYSFTINILTIILTEMENTFSLLKHRNLSFVDLLGEERILSTNVELFLDILEKKIDDFIELMKEESALSEISFFLFSS